LLQPLPRIAECKLLLSVRGLHACPSYTAAVADELPESDILVASVFVQVFLLSTIAQPADQGGPGSLPYKQWG